jgi:hypothetical protein
MRGITRLGHLCGEVRGHSRETNALAARVWNRPGLGADLCRASRQRWQPLRCVAERTRGLTTFARPYRWSILRATGRTHGRAPVLRVKEGGEPSRTTGSPPSSTSMKDGKGAESMSAHRPTGFNWAEAIQPLEARRKSDRIPAASERATRSPVLDADRRRRNRGRAQRNWWALLGPNQ